MQRKDMTAEQYYNRGLALHKEGQYELAIQDYTHAIALKKDLVEAYHNRGFAYYALKKYDLAIADLDFAISHNLNTASTYIIRGKANYILKKYDLALADFTNGISLNPNDAKAYYYRGSVNNTLKKYDLAIADFTNSISLNPNDAKSYHDRGKVYYNLKKYDLAIADFTNTIRLSPNDASSYNNRAACYLHLKQYDLALADSNNAIRLNPNKATSYYCCGTSYKHLNQHGLAIANLSIAYNKLNSEDTMAKKELEPLIRKELEPLINSRNKSDLFNELTTTLSDMMQIELLTHLDSNTPLGAKFLTPEGWFGYMNNSNDDRMTHEIKEHLSLLTKRINVCTYLLATTLYKNENKKLPPIPMEISLLVFSYFMELSGFNVSDSTHSASRLSRLQMTLFPQLKTRNTGQLVDSKPVDEVKKKL